MMLKNDKPFRYQTVCLSVLFSLLVTVSFAYHEYDTLKERINSDILPSVVTDLNTIANHTQNQFEFLQFTALKNDAMSTGFHPIITEAQPQLIHHCLSKIESRPGTQLFSNRAPEPLDNSDLRNGILLGKGNVNEYSIEGLNILCTVVTTASTNSEVIRLVRSHPMLSSQFYFLPKNEDYIFLFNQSFSDSDLDEYSTPKIKEQSKENSDYTLWVSHPYIDEKTNKKVISFVENIKDYHGEVIGFLVRDLYADNLKSLIAQSLNKRDTNITLMDYAAVTVTNNDNVIFSSFPPSIEHTDTDLLTFKDSDKDYIPSDFGEMHIGVKIPFIFMVRMIFNEQSYLFFLPFFMFLFSYTILQQMLHGIRESDKQYYDSLTKVFNRQGLHHKVYKKVDKAIGNHKKVHLFSIDANKFKHINDKYGHDMGDKAIQLIASTAQHICKPNDDIIRLGGDEFLIVLYIDSSNPFDPQQFITRFNQKLAYDCKAKSVPSFTISAGYVIYSVKEHQTFSQAIREADEILLNKKSVDKIESICEEFDSFDINLSSHEQEIKLDMLRKFNFVEAESLLQMELNPKILSAYRGKLSYLISNYFQMIYECCRENDDLHHYRMKIIDSHYKTGIPMSIFYFLFVKYSNFLLRDSEISHEEFVINNRLLAYELHFISSLKTR
ncbi:sensor domain-containing diguanylate cyclase [Vibrio aphrogenes]|uniref:sensor domain-containing diguanylate cyclase n=1 Tax=Vibrio aphrogenes TaxID=1891186 RepID=UPI000B358C4D|nr:sensor domain-containing diguanylate cyclase [Vibrio aphrogenes]